VLPLVRRLGLPAMRVRARSRGRSRGCDRERTRTDGRWSPTIRYPWRDSCASALGGRNPCACQPGPMRRESLDGGSCAEGFVERPPGPRRHLRTRLRLRGRMTHPMRSLHRSIHGRLRQECVGVPDRSRLQPGDGVTPEEGGVTIRRATQVGPTWRWSSSWVRTMAWPREPAGLPSSPPPLICGAPSCSFGRALLIMAPQNNSGRLLAPRVTVHGLGRRFRGW